MIKSKKFNLICWGIAALGLLFCITGTLMGGIVTGISLSSSGLLVYKGINDSNIDQFTFQSEGMALDKFSSIDMDASFTSIFLEESETDRFEISYQIYSSVEPYIEVKNDCLIVRENSSSKNGLQIMLFGSNTSLFGIGKNPNNSIIISVPKGTMLDEVKGSIPSGLVSMESISMERLNMDLSFGTLEMKGVIADECRLSLDSGTLKIESSETDSIDIRNSFGSINVSDVQVNQTAVLDLDSCDLTVENTDFGKLTLNGSFGTFKGEQITALSMNASLDSGNVDFKELSCKDIYVQNNFGKIKLALTEPIEKYNYDVSTSFGSITVGEEKQDTPFKTAFQTDSDSKIKIDGDSCDIVISQAE